MVSSQLPLKFEKFQGRYLQNGKVSDYVSFIFGIYVLLVIQICNTDIGQITLMR